MYFLMSNIKNWNVIRLTCHFSNCYSLTNLSNNPLHNEALWWSVICHFCISGTSLILTTNYWTKCQVLLQMSFLIRECHSDRQCEPSHFLVFTTEQNLNWSLLTKVMKLNMSKLWYWPNIEKSIENVTFLLFCKQQKWSILNLNGQLSKIPKLKWILFILLCWTRNDNWDLKHFSSIFR